MANRWLEESRSESALIARPPVRRTATREAGVRHRLVISVSRLVLVLAMTLACLAVLASVARPAQAIRRSATVAALVQEVSAEQSELQQTLNELSGEVPATVGGAQYIFLARFCWSETAIDNAAQYVYEHLVADGLDAVRYEDYSASVSGRNVVGEIRGATRPNEIVVICAHFDDKSSTSRAPGADDNASGCAALLWMARHFAGHTFARTIRFVFVDGEEAGYLGSHAYATAARQADEKLIAVVSADMFGRNGAGTNMVALHTRRLAGLRAAQQDLWMAKQYLAAVSTYGVPKLKPRVISLGLEWSDNKSFWAQGYGAIGLIEDQPFDNPYLHTAGDTVAHLTWPYYVHVTEGLVAAAAHLAYIDGMLPSDRIFVSGLAIKGGTTSAGRRVRATARVRDVSFTTVLGATVRGRFTGATSRRVSGITDAAGRVQFLSPTCPRGGVWTFTVTGVSKRGWLYDKALNARTWVRLRYPR